MLHGIYTNDNILFILSFCKILNWIWILQCRSIFMKETLYPWPYFNLGLHFSVEGKRRRAKKIIYLASYFIQFFKVIRTVQRRTKDHLNTNSILILNFFKTTLNNNIILISNLINAKCFKIIFLYNNQD